MARLCEPSMRSSKQLKLVICHRSCRTVWPKERPGQDERMRSDVSYCLSLGTRSQINTIVFNCSLVILPAMHSHLR